ncbi:MAG: ABC transporter permease [Gemmatimonadota bacterium]
MSKYLRLFRLRSRADLEMDQELEAHVQLCIDDLVRQGRSVAEATGEARARFGDYESSRRQLHRSARQRDAAVYSRDRFGAILADARGAVQQLRRARTFTVLAIATLALGIGVATMMFTLVERILLRPLPFPQAERLVMLTGRDSLQQPVETVSAADWLDWQRESRTLATTALHIRGQRMSIALGGSAVRANGQTVTADFFRVLGARFLLGRSFDAEEVQRRDAVVVVSESFWRRQLGANQHVGMALRIDGVPRTVIGVVQSEDIYPEGTDLWLPRALGREGSRANINFLAIARLRPGATEASAAADLSRIARAISAADPRALYSHGVGVAGLQATLVGTAANSLRLLMGAVLLVMLIVCANVATATLGRGASRGVEMAIRASIGAGKARLVQQLLIEHLLLAAAGGVLGVAVAAAGLKTILHFWGAEIPRAADVRMDAGVLVFALGISLVVGVLAGIVPALVGSRVSLRELLSSGGRTATAGRNTAGAVLVGAEVAMAILLLVGAALLIRSFRVLIARDLGFDRRVVTAEIALSGGRYDTLPERRTAYWDAASAAVRSIPGVTAVGIGNWVPLGFAGHSFVEIEGHDVANAGAGYRAVTEGYFDALGIPLLQGRGFTARDDAHSARVAVVNHAMAQRDWPGESPIGKRVRANSMEFNPDGSPAPWLEVVGVVADVRHWGLNGDVEAELYSASRQVSRWTHTMTMLVRGSTPGNQLLPGVRARLASIDPEIPADVGTMEDRLRAQLAPRVLTLTLLTGFAGIALLLASLGVYGVLSHAVVRRQRELAVRAALGAMPRQLVAEVVGWAARILVPGAVLGLVGAWLLTRLMAAQLVEVVPADPWSYAGALMVLGVVAALAVVVPATRAARLDPARTLQAP